MTYTYKNVLKLKKFIFHVKIRPYYIYENSKGDIVWSIYGARNNYSLTLLEK